jgi:hypothetical protein
MPDASTLVAGRYRLGELLGRGGMGRVWRARDQVLDRDVAIKEIILPPELVAADRDAAHRRTLREARAAARLSHPGVVQVYDVLEVDGGTWIVMEYVPSRTLQEVLREDGPLEPRRAARIGLDLLAALQAAHRAGVDHRDVKPANVLLADDGRVMLTDFGIATIEGDTLGTTSDILVGSPEYMSPERARHGNTGFASDLWSLGATLYAAVEGRSPFHRATAMGTLTALTSEEPDPPRRAGVLRPVLDGLLRKDPVARIDAAEAGHLLRTAAIGSYGRATVKSDDVRDDTAAVPTRVAPAAVPVPETHSPAADPPVAGRANAVPGEARAVAAPETAVRDRTAVPSPGGAVAGGGAAVAAPETAVPDRGAVPESEGAVAGAETAVPRPRAVPDADRAAAAGDAAVAVPEAPVYGSTGDRTSRRTGRRRLIPAAVVLLAVLLGAVVWLATRASHAPAGLSPTSSAPANQGTAGATGSATGPGGGAPGGVPGQFPGAGSSAGQPTASAPPTGTTSVGGTSAGSGGTRPPLPAGWRDYHDKTGFSVYVPAGWTRSQKGTIVYFRDSHTGRVLGIDQSDHPKSDPVADWRGQSAYRVKRGDFPNYHEIHIVAVPDYFISAADWEFTFSGRSGTRQHVNNRGFVVSKSQAYGIYWQTTDASWAANLPALRLIFASFRPAAD